MNVFPVTDSALSAAQLAVFVKNKYQLNAAVSARILKTGINHSYLVSNEADQFVLRVYSYQWRTEKEIEAEIRLLNLLKANGLPVSYPIQDASGQTIQYLQAPEGLRYAVLFSFAKGIKMLQFPAALHYKAGEIMAGIHRVTGNLSLDRVHYTPEVLLLESFEELKNFLPAQTEEMQYMLLLQKYLLNRLANTDRGALRKGIVHLDIWFDNMSIDNDALTVFDFDFCGNGLLVFDIAYYILQLYSTEKDENEFNLKKAHFLKGYESVAAISPEEMELIPAAAVSLYFFYLGVQCRRYDNWSNNFLNEIYLKRFINLLVKKWVNHHQMNLPSAAG